MQTGLSKAISKRSALKTIPAPLTVIGTVVEIRGSEYFVRWFILRREHSYRVRINLTALSALRNKKTSWADDTIYLLNDRGTNDFDRITITPTGKNILKSAQLSTLPPLGHSNKQYIVTGHRIDLSSKDKKPVATVELLPCVSQELAGWHNVKDARKILEMQTKENARKLFRRDPKTPKIPFQKTLIRRKPKAAVPAKI
jgi:hypothetical protein